MAWKNPPTVTLCFGVGRCKESPGLRVDEVASKMIRFLWPPFLLVVRRGMQEWERSNATATCLGVG